MAPPVRLELTTSKLTASCSTIELQGKVLIILPQIMIIVNIFGKHLLFSFVYVSISVYKGQNKNTLREKPWSKLKS